MSVVEKIDVGKVLLDLPYNSYSYILPLFSINDLSKKLDLSLLFNKELKKEGINYFNIEAGYKLNIQKEIIISNNKPLKLIDEDGKYINIIENYNDTSKTIPNNVYTFEDESKRILRIISNGYEIENEDFSKEMYNTNGNITNIYINIMIYIYHILIIVIII